MVADDESKSAEGLFGKKRESELEHRPFKALFTGDIHMNNALPHAKPDHSRYCGKLGLTDRMVDQIMLFKEIKQIIKVHELDALYILGDLFDHGKLDVITLNETADCIRAISEIVPVYLLPGNHDAHTTEGLRFNLEAIASLCTNVFCLRSKTSLGEPWQGNTPGWCRDWLHFYPMEYMPLNATRDQLGLFRESLAFTAMLSPGKSLAPIQNILLIHNAINGCKHGDWICDVGLHADDVCYGFDRVLASHFHTHQTFGPDNRGMYLSAPMHHRFDDCGRPTYVWIGEFRRGAPPSFTSVTTTTPRFYELEYGDDMSELAGLRERDYLRIRVTATQPDWLELQPVLNELVESMQERCINASVLHRPVYHHKSRIFSEATAAKTEISILDNIQDYVNSEYVDTGSLDKAKLAALGREILSKSEKAAT